MVTVINYGLGNIQAFHNVFTRQGIRVHVATTPAEVRDAERIILPGVGAFDWAMSRLQESGMRDALEDQVLRHATPVLGVCVGMQMMAKCSAEGVLPGLGWINATVRRLDDGGQSGRLRLPHMGWNDVTQVRAHPLFANLAEPRFYFLHSYHVVPEDHDDVLGTTQYGADFASAVGRAHIMGVQFHPEKSHGWGGQLLRNFATL